MRDCTECQTAQGDECVLYTGSSCPDCGLVSEAWYKVDDLITLLECKAINCGGTTTTTTTSTTTTTTTTVPPDILMSFVDQVGSGCSIVLMPGAYFVTPGSGTTLNIPEGNYTLFVTNATYATRLITYRDQFSNPISSTSISLAGQPIAVGIVYTVLIQSA